MSQTQQDHEYWMTQALSCAKKGEEQGEVPVGAVLVLENQLISQAWNCPIYTKDPTAHAEIQVLRHAGQVLQNYRLVETTLYVTLEPCLMCAGALVHARVKQLIFGAFDPKAGAVQSVFTILDQPQLNHRVHYTGGVLHEPCSQLLKTFFQTKRMR